MPIDVLSSQNRSFPAAAVIRETNEELFLQVCRLLDKKAALLRLIAQSTGTWGFWLCIDIHSGCKALLVSPERMQGAAGVAREDASVLVSRCSATTTMARYSLKHNNASYLPLKKL
jgi:hypothetical protein